MAQILPAISSRTAPNCQTGSKLHHNALVAPLASLGASPDAAVNRVAVPSFADLAW
jgi:hypothetical protein